MKLLKKVLSVMMMCAAIVSLSSCSDLKVKEQMQEGIDAYIAAVAKSEKRESGSVKVVSLSKDNAIEFKNTESVIECDFTVTDGKVSYTRSDYLNGEKAAEYKCDGNIVLHRNNDGEAWTDRTEENSSFLSAQTNPLTTLSLFRVDSKYKVRTDYMTDIKYNSVPDENGYTSVEFTLKDSTVSDILDYNKARGIVRRSAGHTRTYYIDSSGYIAKIVVLTNQVVFNNGKEGSYNTEMTVVCS